MQDVVRGWLFDPTVGKIVALLVGVVAVLVIKSVIQRSLVARIKDNDTRYRVRKAVTFGAYVALILVGAAVLSDQLGSLTVAFGVAGAGIAFALQEVIASVAGWFAVSFGRFFRTGDRIQLGGIKGDVIDVGVLRTTLMECGQWVNGDLYNGRIVRVANSFVFKEPVVNYSADYPFVWDEIDVPVKHGCDPGAVQAILDRVAENTVLEYARDAASSWREVVKKYRIEDAQVDPMVTLTADANWMTFTLRYVVDYRKRRSTRDLLWRRVLAGIDASCGAVKLAGATLSVDSPGIDVRLVGAAAAGVDS